MNGSKIGFSISGAVTIICFFSNSFTSCQRIIVVLACIIVSLLIALYEQRKEINELLKVKSKHRALANQYQYIANQLHSYQSAFNYIKACAFQVIISSKEDRFKHFYDTLLSIEKYSIRGGQNNETDSHK